jgi:hypothetical protein
MSWQQCIGREEAVCIGLKPVSNSAVVDPMLLVIFLKSFAFQVLL